MRRLVVFNHVTLDGYFTDPKGDMSWAHRKSDPEWDAFVAENVKGDSEMVFGRITYDLMASYWPTPMALKNDPAVAGRMNGAKKVVFSKTLGQATWSNTTLVKQDPAGTVRRMKEQPGPDILIFGSGTIVSELTQERLIDEYQIVVNPIVIGRGKSMFSGVTEKLKLKQTRTRSFTNGNVLLWYEPAK